MTQRTKLLLLIPHLGGGGAERVTALLASHLSLERFEVHLGLVTPDRESATALPAHVKIHRLQAARVRHGWLALLRLIWIERPDLILSGMAHLNFLVLALRPFLPWNTRILVRQNTTASASVSSRIARLPYRVLYPRADRIVCQSKAMAQDLAENFALPRSKLAVAPNPIDFAALHEDKAFTALSESGSQSESGPVLLAIGRLAKEKGMDLLLHAFAAVKRQHPAIKLTIAGTGPEEPALNLLIGELALEGHVSLAGYASDIAACYRSATLFVLPSRYEGMPNALLEAAAAGLPIVATPCCEGVRELLTGAPGAWLASAVTAEALAAAILAALESPPSRFEHAFLAPFKLPNAIAAWESLLSSFSAQQSRMVHVAFLIPTIDQIGGAERQVILLAKELSSRGRRVTLIVLSGSPSRTAPELAAVGVATLSLEMRKAWVDPRGWLRYHAWVARHRPDIVHAHLSHATWFARWMRLLTPIRVQVDTIHTSRTGGPGNRLGYRLTQWLTDHVTCVSKAVALATCNAGMASRRKLTVIPNGVVLSERASAQQQTHSSFLWIAVGRLAPVKDYPTLLRAFALLPAGPRLQIAGSGPEEQSLRALAAELNIADRVEFAGFQPDVQPLLLRADAFVQASLWEGLPVSILEASAAALPIVATDAAGTREAIIPGETGLLVPVGDVAALARAMAQMMAMPPEMRRQMGARGRQLVEEKYALGIVADAWEALYMRLLNENPKPARRGVHATRSAVAAAASTLVSASASLHEKPDPAPLDFQSATRSELDPPM